MPWSTTTETVQQISVYIPPPPGSLLNMTPDLFALLFFLRVSRKLRPSKHRPQTSDLENPDLENPDLENTDLENTDLENPDLAI